MKRLILILSVLTFFRLHAEQPPGDDFVCTSVTPPKIKVDVASQTFLCPGESINLTPTKDSEPGSMNGYYKNAPNIPVSLPLVIDKDDIILDPPFIPYQAPDKYTWGWKGGMPFFTGRGLYEDCNGQIQWVEATDKGFVSLENCYQPPPPNSPDDPPVPGGSGGSNGGGGSNGSVGGEGDGNENCEEPAQPDQGIAEFFGGNGGWMVWPAPNEAWSEADYSNSVWFAAIHHIVTINTPAQRDLTGVIRLNKVSGDESCVDLVVVNNDIETSYTLGQDVPITEPDHSGCGVHDWHQGSQIFGFIPKEAGQVVLEAEVDPDAGSPQSNAQLTITIAEVDKIIASSEKSGNGTQEFEGNNEWPFNPSAFPDPGQHLVVFFKDVINDNLEVQDFEVDLQAEINPETLSEDQVLESWNKLSGPGGELNRNDTFQVKLQDFAGGGVYKVQFNLGLVTLLPKSEANIVLPLAGAEVQDVVANDLVKADIFAEKVLASYTWVERQDIANGVKWFYNNKAGDYVGRPNNNSNPTVRFYNQVDDDVGEQGFGAVVTWFGIPVRIAKISNFIVAYATHKIGVNPIFAWISQVLGSWNDSAASKSWDAGWEVAGGADYEATAQALVEDIFDEVDDITEKHKKLWPNHYPPDNQQPCADFVDYNSYFCSPGFTEMENP